MSIVLLPLNPEIAALSVEPALSSSSVSAPASAKVTVVVAEMLRPTSSVPSNESAKRSAPPIAPANMAPPSTVTVPALPATVPPTLNTPSIVADDPAPRVTVPKTLAVPPAPMSRMLCVRLTAPMIDREPSSTRRTVPVLPPMVRLLIW